MEAWSPDTGATAVLVELLEAVSPPEMVVTAVSALEEAGLRRPVTLFADMTYQRLVGATGGQADRQVDDPIEGPALARRDRLISVDGDDADARRVSAHVNGPLGGEPPSWRSVWRTEPVDLAQVEISNQTSGSPSSSTPHRSVTASTIANPRPCGSVARCCTRSNSPPR